MRISTQNVWLSIRRQLPVIVVVGLLLCTSVAGLIFKPNTAQALTASTMNFQARLMNGSGSIAPDGDYNVEFKLYNAATPDGGETPLQGSCTTNPGAVTDEDCVWTETRTSGNKVHVVNGYLTVNLGSVTSFGGTINWDQDLWLTMNVGGTGSPSWDGEMSPRLKLTAVPYAFRAGQLAQFNSSTGFTSTLNLAQPTGGNQTFNILDQGAAGTYNILTAAAGTDGYIKLQAATPGTPQTGHFNISGTGIANALQAATIDTPSGTTTLSIGATNATAAVNIGSSAVTAVSLQSAGSVNVGNNANNKTINIGVTAATANTTTVNIATSTGAAQTINIGSTNGASAITMKVGTGNFVLDGVAGSTYALGASTTTGTIAIGGTAQTGDLVLGSSSGTNIVAIGGGAGATTVNIANANTSGAVNIGAAMISGTITIGGTGLQTGTIGIGTGTGAQALNFGTGGTGAKTVIVGSTASTGATTIQSGTGGTGIQSASTGAISIGTANNNAITTGTGLLTQGGDMTFNGTAARTITGPATGGLTINTTTGPLTLSTTTSGILAVTSAGALNLTGAANSTWSVGGGNTVGITSSNFNVTTGGVVNVLTGYQIGGAAASGNYLRGNGTNFVSSAIQSADIPACSGSCNYISNQTSQQSSSNFNISGTGAAGVALQAPLFQTTDVTGASAAISFRSGNSTTSGNTGNVTIASGAATSGNSGDISVDAGTASGTKGTITIGGAQASALFVGRSGLTTQNQGALTVTQLLTASASAAVTGTLTVTSSNTSGNSVSVANTALNTNGANLANLTFTNANSSATSTEISGVSITPTGTTNANSNANRLNAINLPNVTTIANNAFSALNVGTGYNDLLRYNGTQLISGTGFVQNAAIDSSVTYSNIQKVGTLTAGALSTGFTTVNVAQGGTGAGTFTANGVLYGNGTGALGVTAPGTTGQCLLGNTSSAPTWGTCATATLSLQNAYAGGNVISTSGTPIAFTLNNSDNFTVTTAVGGTGSSIFSLADGANPTPPAQLISVSNNDVDQIVANGITIGAAAGGITDGLDVSDTDITNAVNVGDNVIIGTTATINFTNFDVSGAGAVVAVGVDSGAGLLQGTAGLTVTGNINLGSVGASTAASTTHIGDTSNGTGVQTISLGSNANSGNLVDIDAGTGATGIEIGNSATAHGIQIGSNATGDNDILIGGAHSGSTLSLEAGTAAGSLAVGNGATNHNIQIGTNATGNQVITIGATANTSDITTIQGGGAAAGGILLNATTVALNAANPILTSSGANSLTVQTTGNGDLTLQTSSSSAHIVLKSNNNSATAIQIQSSGDVLLKADTSNNRIIIGNSTATTGADTTAFVFDQATTTNQPWANGSGVLGAIFFDTTKGQLQCYEGASVGAGTWGDCGSTTLQGAYNNTAALTPAPAQSILSTSAGKAVTIQTANSGGIAAGSELFGIHANAASDVLGASILSVNSAGVGINMGAALLTNAFSYDLTLGTGSTRTIGVQAPTTNVSGNGLTIQAATGGTGAAANAGGDLKLQGGAGGGTNGNGGTAYLFGGAKNASGTDGNVVLAHNGTSAIGNVGIGTAAPTRTLHVVVNNTTVATPNILVEQSNAAGDSSVEFKNAATAQSYYLGLNSSTSAFTINSSSAAASSPSTIAFVQAPTAINPGGSGTTIGPLAYGSNTTAGNLLVAVAAWDTTNTSTGTCSDGVNTWSTAIIRIDASLKDALLVCYAPNIAGGPVSVTVTLGAAAGSRYLTVLEYSGVARVNPVDVTASNLATSVAGTDGVTSTAATTTQNGDLVFGATYNTSGSSVTHTAGTGFTQRTVIPAVTPFIQTEDRVQALAGSVASTHTFSAVRTYLADMVTFKAATTVTDAFALPLFTLNTTGAANFKNSVDSSTAFQIQNAATSPIFNVDTSSGRVGINTSAPTADISFGVGSRTINVVTQTAANTAGSALTVVAGAGNGTGAGGTLSLQGGAAGATAGAAGGGVTISGSNGTSTGTGGAGGNVSFVGGDAAGSSNNAGGNVTARLGAATGTGAQGMFQVQNALGATLLSVDPSNTAASLNLAVNSGGETATGFTTTYPAAGFGTNTAVSQTVTSGEFASGSAAVKAIITPAAATAGVRANLGAALATSSIYAISFSAKTTSSNWTSDIDVRYNRTGTTSDGATAVCTTSNSGGSSFNTRLVTTTGWTKINCYITTSASAGDATANIVIFQTASATRTFYVDNLSVVQQNASGTQDVGVLRVGGAITQGLTLLTLDTSATQPFTGANASLAGSMYFDTTQSKIQCYDGLAWGACGAAPDNIITLTPEYAGAVLNGTGIGTMTSDFCATSGALTVGSLCGSGDARNFYKWTSPQTGSLNEYDIYVTYKLPATFKNFSSNTTITLTARTDNTTNGIVTLEVYRAVTGGSPSITACGTETDITTSGGANVWSTVAGNGSETSCGFLAGNNVIFKIRAKAKSSANVYIENLNFTFTNQ